MFISLCYIQSSDAIPPNYKYKPMQVTDGGVIKGVIKFEGQAPQMKKVEVNKDTEVCGATAKYEETLIVGEGNALKNVIVYLVDISKGAEFPKGKTYEIDQKSCQFIPHVQVVPIGEKLTMLNNDGILHNVHTHGKQKGNEVNIAQPKFRKQLPLTLGAPEIGVRVTCDAHSWMGGWLAIMPHPYYAVTNEKGEYMIKDAPAGTYKLAYWHEYCGSNEKEPVSVTVTAGGTAIQDFTLKKAAQ
jgi:plastocyanin